MVIFAYGIEDQNTNGLRALTRIANARLRNGLLLMRKNRQAVILSSVVWILLVLSASGADPLDQWAWRNPLPTGSALRRIAYGNNQFVAVGAYGTIVTSPDGLAWTSHTLGTDHDLQAITYANNQFVAVGGNNYDLPLQIYPGGPGTMVTSPDGNIWTDRSPPTAQPLPLFAVAYGRSQFVAVGGNLADNVVVTSPDGISQTNRPLGRNTDLIGIPFSGVVYANNQYVAVGRFGTIVTSSDAITWTLRSSTTDNDLQAIAYANSQFVAVGTLGTIVSSADGLRWTNRPSGTTNALRGVAYGNNQFVAVGDSGTVATSPDGLNWMNRASGAGNLYAVGYGNHQFIAVGNPGTIATSFDAITWSGRAASGPSANFSDITYGNNQYVAVGSTSACTDTNAVFCGVTATSSDGIAWSHRNLGVNVGFSHITYGNHQFVAVGGAIASSADGLTWTDRSAGVSNNLGLNAIGYLNNQFVAVGGVNRFQTDGIPYSTIVTSPDGLTWSKREAGMATSLYAVTYGNNQFVAVGGESGLSAIVTSPDGITWTKRDSGTRQQAFPLFGIAYGNHRFVAVGGFLGDLNTLVTSPDGLSWTEHSLEVGLTLLDVVYGNNLFVAVGADRNGASDLIVTSPDGITWTRRGPGGHGYLDRIAYYPSVGFVALGAGGVVVSPDGIAWTRHTWDVPVASALARGNNTFVVVGGAGTILQSGVIGPAQPVLGPLTFLPGGQVQVTLTGQPGQSYPIQASTDLVQWQIITNLALTNASGQFVDRTTNLPRRFYRAVVQ